MTRSLPCADGRVVVSVVDGVVKIAVMPARSLALSVMFGLHITATAGMTLFAVVTYYVQGQASPWLLLPVGFASLMVAYVASLLRWNLKGTEHVEVSAKQVRYSRAYHPVSNSNVSYENVRTFELWRPQQEGMGRFDYQIWRMGAWALGVVSASGKKVELVKRLTRHDAELIAEMLRSAGHSVLGAEDRAGAQDRLG